MSSTTSRFHSPFLGLMSRVFRPIVGTREPIYVSNLMVSGAGLTCLPMVGHPRFFPWSSVLRAKALHRVLIIEVVPKNGGLSPFVFAWPFAGPKDEVLERLKQIEALLGDRFRRSSR